MREDLSSNVLSEIADDAMAIRKRPRAEEMEEDAPCRKKSKEDNWAQSSSLSSHMLGIVEGWLEVTRPRKGEYIMDVFCLYGDFVYNNVAQNEAHCLVNELRAGKPFKVVEYNMNHDSSRIAKKPAVGALGVALLYNPDRFVTSSDILKMINFIRESGLRVGVCILNQEHIVQDSETPLPIGINHHRLGLIQYSSSSTQTDEMIEPSMDESSPSIQTDIIEVKPSMDDESFDDDSLLLPCKIEEECTVDDGMTEILDEFFGNVPRHLLPDENRNEIMSLFSDENSTNDIAMHNLYENTDD